MAILRCKKGNADIITFAGMVVVLYIVAVIIGNLQSVGSSTLASNTAALQSYNNVTSYTITGIVLGSLGLIVFAGVSLLGMLGKKR